MPSEPQQQQQPNAYLQARSERLKRNREYLKSLGLDSNSAVRAAAPRTTKPKREPRREAVAPSRRSTRVIGAPAEHVALPDDFDDRVLESRARRQSTALDAPQAVFMLKRPKPTSTEAKSSSLVNVQSEKLAMDWVGTMFEPPPGPDAGQFKAFVVNSIAHERASFSKYEGLLRFKNATVLFVNVGGDCYENLFHDTADGGQTMDWFGNDRQTKDSPAVQQLVTPGWDVFLFLRFPGGPYLCCGLLELVNWSGGEGKQRLRVQWKFVAIDKLRNVPAFRTLTQGGGEH